MSVGSATLGMRCHTDVGARFHSRTEVPDSGRARLSDEALGNCNLSSNGYLSLRASWRSFGEGVAVPGNYPLTVGNKNPYVDHRLGGIPRYSLTPRKDIDMRVPDEVLKSVVFIGVQQGAVTKYIGTGFFVLLREQEAGLPFQFTYLVTAGHVADDVDGIPFTIRINKRSGALATVNENEAGDFKWYRHPKGKVVDIAVCPWLVPSREFDAKSLDTAYFLTPELAKETGIGVGDEVLMVGLFSKITDEARLIPITRIGNLAMIPSGSVVPTDLGD